MTDQSTLLFKERLIEAGITTLPKGRPRNDVVNFVLSSDVSEIKSLFALPTEERKKFIRDYSESNKKDMGKRFKDLGGKNEVGFSRLSYTTKLIVISSMNEAIDYFQKTESDALMDSLNDAYFDYNSNLKDAIMDDFDNSNLMDHFYNSIMDDWRITPTSTCKYFRHPASSAT